MPYPHASRYPSIWACEQQPSGLVDIQPMGPTYLFWPAMDTVLGRAPVPIFTTLRPPVKQGFAGRYWDFTDTTGGVGDRRVGLRMNRPANYESSWELLVRWQNTGAASNVAACMSASSNAATNPVDHRLAINGTNGPFYSIWDGNATRTASLASSPHDNGEIVHYVAVSRYNLVAVYTNGIERASSAASSPGEFYVPAFLVLGGAASVNFNCEIYYAAWYDRQLSPAEIAARAADPYGRLVRPTF